MTTYQTFAPFTDINWEEPFDPLYGSVIEIPEYTILWRGYNTSYPVLSDRPSYYSSKEVASGYVLNEQTHKLGCFMTTRPLRLLDVRFMKNLLSRMIQMYYDDKTINDFVPIMISFGLCSLQHQIRITKLRYQETLQRDPSPSNPIRAGIVAMEKSYQPNSFMEQIGVRIAETINDGGVMTFLKEFFKDKFDGFVSPRISSVFHVEKPNGMSPEMILFAPKQIGLIQIPYHNDTYVPHPYTIKKHTMISGTRSRSFIDFIDKKHTLIHLPTADHPFTFYMSAGSISETNNDHPLNTYQTHIKKKVIKEFDENCKRNGKKWKDKFQYKQYNAPHPHVTVSVLPSRLPPVDHTIIERGA